jgi:hypothetical protein
MDIESEEGIRSVVLRRSEASSLGFSIMGGAGYEFPPVIYGIERDSPAARSGMVRVKRFTTYTMIIILMYKLLSLNITQEQTQVSIVSFVQGIPTLFYCFVYESTLLH